MRFSRCLLSTALGGEYDSEGAMLLLFMHDKGHSYRQQSETLTAMDAVADPLLLTSAWLCDNVGAEMLIILVITCSNGGVRKKARNCKRPPTLVITVRQWRAYLPHCQPPCCAAGVPLGAGGNFDSSPSPQVLVYCFRVPLQDHHQVHIQTHYSPLFTSNCDVDIACTPRHGLQHHTQQIWLANTPIAVLNYSQ